MPGEGALGPVLDNGPLYMSLGAGSPTCLCPAYAGRNTPFVATCCDQQAVRGPFIGFTNPPAQGRGYQGRGDS